MDGKIQVRVEGQPGESRCHAVEMLGLVDDEATPAPRREWVVAAPMTAGCAGYAMVREILKDTGQIGIGRIRGPRGARLVQVRAEGEALLMDFGRAASAVPPVYAGAHDIDGAAATG